MSLKSKGKSVADTGAYEHLVALPNCPARRLPQTGLAGCESGPTPAPEPAGDYYFAYPIFQRATNTPARWAPPDWTMTEAEAGFKFCCRSDSRGRRAVGQRVFNEVFHRIRCLTAAQTEGDCLARPWIPILRRERLGAPWRVSAC